jgi:predicted alternative tryptophan synthase beta-subunit
MWILNVWSGETQISCIAAKSLSEPSRHADLRKVSNQEAPKHPGVLGRAIRRAPHREACIPDVKILGRSSELTMMTAELEEGLGT